MIEHAQAVVDHHFNNHTHCGVWCKWSPQHEVIPAQTPAEKKTYCCKVRHKEMYDLVKQNMEPYFTKEMLEMCRHNESTQKMSQ